jgi:hypothetical protein
MQSPTNVQVCRAAAVDVATSTPMVRVGVFPQCSVIVAKESDRSMRVLDVRNGRRVDLQDEYFELVVIEGRKVVDLPRAISDPDRFPMRTTQC